MSESYTGSNAGPLNVTFTIPTDGDDVDALSVNTVFQPNADNWQYAKRVYPNLLTGGDYSGLGSANLIVGNAWTFKGDVVFNAADNYIANGGTLHIGNSVIGAGTLAFAAGFASMSGQVTMNQTSVYSGNNAYRVNRKTAISAAGVSLAAEQWDTVWLFNSGASYDVTLTDPNSGTPLPEGIRCTFVVPGFYSAGGGTIQTLNTGTVNVKDVVADTLASFAAPAAGTLKSVTIETVSVGGTIRWDAKEWAVFKA